MHEKNAMSLKAEFKKLARQKNMSPQVVLQNYMFERFLERLSKSKYKNNFILKGGILVAALIGIDNRSTMDMDVTIRNYHITAASLTQVITDIFKTEVHDEVRFILVKIDPIRIVDSYKGYRVRIKAIYETIIVPIAIDITTGDAITPRAIFYPFKKNFGQGTIGIWAYNIETILAEKVETILQRGEQNTRPRDFYDIYILVKTQEFDKGVFSIALKNTAEHRGTEYILTNLVRRVELIKMSTILKERWSRYSKSFPYAKELIFEDVIYTLEMLINL